jgi:Fic family protein
MRRTYLWQKAGWPHFDCHQTNLLPALLACAEGFGQLEPWSTTRAGRLESEVRAFVDDAVTTTAIEGETLDPNAVRASIVRRLSLPGSSAKRSDDRTEGVIDVTLDAIDNYAEPVSRERLFTHVSHDTANRDLLEMVRHGILTREGGSKNTNYRLIRDRENLLPDS